MTPKIRTEIVKVTPEMATKWLEGKCHNRPIRDSRVHQYAGDMKAGRFRLTHQGVAFDEDDRLIDGQHRLYAILEANVAVEVLVSKGWPRETQQFVDEGLPRTVADVIRLADPDSAVSGFRVAAARRMLIGTRTQVIVSRQELIGFMDTHDKAITFSLEDSLQKKRVLRVTPAPVAAVIGRAYYHEDLERLRAFGRVMLGEIPSGKTDGAAYQLREWLLQGAPAYGVQISRDLLIYQKVQRALVAFLRGEQLRNLYPMKDEVWALTGEQRRLRSK